MAKIKLEVSSQGGYHRYTAQFATEAQAVAFIEARMSTHNFYVPETEEGGRMLDQYWALDALLFPECEHGLSLTMCYGPNHYPSDAQEREMWIGGW